LNHRVYFRCGVIRNFLAAVIFLLLSSKLAFTQNQIVSINGVSAVADEIIVRLKTPDASALARVANVIPAATVDVISSDLMLHTVKANGQSVAALIQAFSNHPDVLYAEPNYIVSSVKSPNDAMYPSLWGMPNIGAPSAWNVTTGATSAVIGVIDSGVEHTHPDLAANMWSAPSAFTVTVGGRTISCPAGSHGINVLTWTCDPMDDLDHGTHVAGTIGARGDNAIGVAGVNWNARIMGLKFLDSQGNGSTSAAISCIEFARQVKKRFAGTATPVDVRVLSNSWGGGGFSQGLLDQINFSNAENILFVAAAGNYSSDNDIVPFYPASYNAPNVISVAATTSSDGFAGFSNFGATKVHLGAPGQSILSTTRGLGYTYKSGTSMATPHVAGAALLTLAACPGLSTAALKSAILTNVDPLPSLQGRTITGGRLNVDKMVRSCIPTMPLLSSINPAFAGTSVTFTATINGSNPTGTVNFTDGGATFGSCGAVALAGSGNSKTAACTTSGLSVGSHNIAANYSGDGSNPPVVSTPLTQIINAVPSAPGGLTGQWSFDETAGNTAADSSGNGNPGTLINGPLWNSFGKAGGALSFDGVNDYVSLGNPSKLIPANAITMAGWLKLNSVSSNKFIISKYDEVAPHNATFLRYQAGAGITCSVGGTSVLGAASIIAGTWYHAACTYDGSSIRVYINGVQAASLARSGAIGDEAGTDWLIGARTPASPAIFVDGMLDDIRMYDLALSATEINQLSSDTAVPVLGNGAPSGSLPEGTAQTTLSVSTSENATCRYATVPGTAFGAMTGVFSTTGTMSHSTHVSGLSGGNTYTFFVRCLDANSNANSADYPISFSVTPSVPPVLSNGSPSGALPIGTTQTTLSLTTNEIATCRYSTLPGTPYLSMPYVFSNTGGMTHSTMATGLSGGNSYIFYVRCQDAVSNADTADYAISFSVPSSDTTPPVLSNSAPSGVLPAGTTQTTLSLTTNENATCRYATVPGTAYASMPNLFSTSGGTSQATLITGLLSGNTYTYYVRCRDVAGNANTTDLAIGFAVGASIPPATSGLKGHWGLDETAGAIAGDSSGNNNFGVLINGAVWNNSGRIGGALSFDGVNDYVSLEIPHR
jgi:subtilisin family serine protease